VSAPRHNPAEGALLEAYRISGLSLSGAKVNLR
jgi:hypothetical protein